MSKDERFVELWTNYLEGDFDESRMVELRELLADNESLLKLATDTYQTHRLLGVLATEKAAEHDDFVRDTLARLPESGDQFTSHVMQCLDGHPSQELLGKRHDRQSRRFFRQSGWIVAVLSLVALLFVWFQVNERTDRKQVAKNEAFPVERLSPSGEVRFAKLAHAQFFGELSPSVQSILAPHRDYVLMSGLVEVAFPKGATAIIEGPALFRVLSDEALALDVGRCSVHAPDGAEGFRIDTPVTRVVDRGTRFAVNVSEAGETAVQVIEGIADVYHQSNDEQTGPTSIQADSDLNARFELRLTSREASRFVNDRAFAAQPVSFNPSLYRRQLPDRVVSFAATTADDGRAEHLTQVTVQRAGRATLYSIDDLIPSDLIWFHSGSDRGSFVHLASGQSVGEFRKDLLSDAALNTGVINPGGSVVPLSSDPVMETTEDENRPATPGMAVRFRSPVTNGPGPDVVLFELQTYSNPPNGDAFHVSPLEFGANSKSHTIRVYDLTLASPEALKLTNFYTHNFAHAVTSLAELQSTECVRAPARLNFHVLAVGIDLSDLGYVAGESIDGLFFQDAMDDRNFIDPVFIAGLPAVE
jgi:FecR protein